MNQTEKIRTLVQWEGKKVTACMVPPGVAAPYIEKVRCVWVNGLLRYDSEDVWKIEWSNGILSFVTFDLITYRTSPDEVVTLTIAWHHKEIAYR